VIPRDVGGAQGNLGDKMKRVLSLMLLALALPVASFANSADFTNSGGTLSGSTSGLSSTGSTLIAVNGLDGGGLLTGNLGTLTFSTGALSSGTLAGGATFLGGGSFTITGNGNGVPNGVIFAGAFDGPSTWTLITLSNGTHNYTLLGVVDGQGFSGTTVQLTINTGKGFFNGTTRLASGDTNVTNNVVAVPEPSSISLLCACVLCTAWFIRRNSKYIVV
jgi:hypothetical protein